MSVLSSDYLEKIRWIVQTCGQQAREMAEQPFEVFEKGVEDYVTDVDRALDQRLSAALAAFFPEDGIISEENASSRQQYFENYRRLWLIDPLDGTEDFIGRRSHYAVMVGLLTQQQPAAGWIYAPSFEHLYCGGVDCGLFEAIGDRPLTPLIPKEPPAPSMDYCPMVIGTRDQQQHGRAIAQLIPEARFSNLGSFGLKVMEVICGNAGIYVYFNRRVKLWDTVGPLALARAAGLVCCDLEGNPLRFTSDAIDPDTLAHRQTIVVGWESYVAELRSRLKQAVYS